MGLYDRPYMRDDQQGFYGPAPGRGGHMRLALPKPTKAVKWLLAVNIAAFIVQLVSLLAFKLDLAGYFGATAGGFWQVWRYVTFQFLHDPGSLWHLALNMLGLYMLGTPLERAWGSRRFVTFYLVCGAAAGATYVVVSWLLLPSWLRHIPLIGASGGVYAILLVCAVMFPHFRLIFFLFPVPIRLAALIVFGGMALLILMTLSRDGAAGPEFWSNVCHLGGAVAAAFWLWGMPRLRGAGAAATRKVNRGAWQRKLAKRADRQMEIDRILRKIHQHGIASLTGKEQKKLRDATRSQQQEDRDLYKL